MDFDADEEAIKLGLGVPKPRSLEDVMDEIREERIAWMTEILSVPVEDIEIPESAKKYFEEPHK